MAACVKVNPSRRQQAPTATPPPVRPRPTVCYTPAGMPHEHHGHHHVHTDGHGHSGDNLQADHPEHHNHAVVGDLRVALAINVLFTIIEFVGGFLTNSVAIIADAVHDLGDSVTLSLALVMERIAGRGRTGRQTFGYRRYSTLGALFTGVILVVGAVTVLFHAIPRILDPEPVESGGMIALALLGVAMNVLAALRLSRSSSMNARAAFLHLMEDVFGWVAVLLGAIAIRVWGIVWLDPVLSVGINVFVLSRAIPVLVRAMRVFLQYVPADISVDELQERLGGDQRITDVHDIHVWSLDGEYTLFSAHIVTDGDRTVHELEDLKHDIRTRLAEAGIDHVTVQFEAVGAGCSDCDL